MCVCMCNRAAVGDLRALIEKIDNGKDETYACTFTNIYLCVSQGCRWRSPRAYRKD